jgi:hypothetical protein
MSFIKLIDYAKRLPSLLFIELFSNDNKKKIVYARKDRVES